jgi:hypothetical protein
MIVQEGTGTASPSRPESFEDRYRLYIDESGDHVFRTVQEPAHRYLCLLGCWFRNPDYLRFHAGLEALKAQYLPHHPDDPVILHREDMINKRRAFSSFRHAEIRDAWDQALLELISRATFAMVAVVIDKQRLAENYGDASAHPYHLGLGFMLQRYAGFMNHINRAGDVMAESRGGKEDRLLKDSYERAYTRGAWRFTAEQMQRALTSSQLKLKVKSANISGLQLADLLGHPAKQWVLREKGVIEETLPPFSARLMELVEPKFNKHLYSGRVSGYGYVLYP